MEVEAQAKQLREQEPEGLRLLLLVLCMVGLFMLTEERVTVHQIIHAAVPLRLIPEELTFLLPTVDPLRPAPARNGFPAFG